MPKALVIGGGPVGSLTALSFHNRGWEVEVWETREGAKIFYSMSLEQSNRECICRLPTGQCRPRQPPINQPGLISERDRSDEVGRS